MRRSNRTPRSARSLGTKTTYSIPPAPSATNPLVITEVTKETVLTFKSGVHLLNVKTHRPKFFTVGTEYKVRIGRINGFACTIYTIAGIDYEQI